MKSKLLRLNIDDFAKGLIVAMLTSVMAVAAESLNHGSLFLNWTLIANSAIIGGLGYLSKNLLSNNSGEFLKKNRN